MVKKRTKTDRLLGSMKEKRIPIASEMFLPNHSGDHSKGRVLTTPTQDYEIVNKKYVDDNTFWDRTDTVLSPKTAGDDVSLEFGDLISEQNPDVVDAIRIKGTSGDVDVVLANARSYFTVWNFADTTAVFYVNNVGDTDIAGDLTVTGDIIVTGTVDGIDIAARDHDEIHALSSHTQGSDKIFYTKGAVFTELSIGAVELYLKSAGPGNNLVWDDPVTVPGGATTQVQFNDAGDFAGATGLAWDKVNNQTISICITDTGLQLNHQVLTAATLTLDKNDSIIECDTTSNAIAITLPECSTVLGQIYTIHLETRPGTNNVTITTAAGDVYAQDRDIGDNTCSLDVPGEFFCIQAVSNTTWAVIGKGGNVLTTV